MDSLLEAKYKSLTNEVESMKRKRNEEFEHNTWRYRKSRKHQESPEWRHRRSNSVESSPKRNSDGFENRTQSPEDLMKKRKVARKNNSDSDSSESSIRRSKRHKRSDEDSDGSNYRRLSRRYRERSRSRRRDRRRRSRSRTRDSRDRAFRFRGRFDRDRRRSPSPPPGTVPLDERVRIHSNWDVAPPGYEHLSVNQIKSEGLFPLPSHLAVAKLAPVSSSFTSLQHDLKARFGSLLIPGPSHSSNTLARQQRRLYIGGLPPNINDAELLNFFNTELERKGFNSSASTAIFGGDRTFAFIELRDSNDATNAISLDGISFKGSQLKIRRPKDYIAPSSDVSPSINDSPDKLFIGGIPQTLSEEQIKELLQSFGDLQSFTLIKDPVTLVSKGYAFCEYLDTSIADIAIEGLNNMEIGDRRLVVQRASVKQEKTQVTPYQHLGVDQIQSAPTVRVALEAAGGVGQPSRILLLLNMAPAEMLGSSSHVNDILLDVIEECEKCGNIIDAQVPPVPTDAEVPPIVRVFVEFAKVEACESAFRRLAGRLYAGRTVIASYFPEERWRMAGSEEISVGI